MNPFKRISKEFVIREIRNMEWQLEEMEQRLEKMRWKVRDLKKRCGIKDSEV